MSVPTVHPNCVPLEAGFQNLHQSFDPVIHLIDICDRLMIQRKNTIADGCPTVAVTEPRDVLNDDLLQAGINGIKANLI